MKLDFENSYLMLHYPTNFPVVNIAIGPNWGEYSVLRFTRDKFLAIYAVPEVEDLFVRLPNGRLRPFRSNLQLNEERN